MEITRPTNPIKRNVQLQPLSRDHHHGLLLCWKIRTGLTKKIPLGRIAEYVKFYYQEELEPHFFLEEQTVFTLLPPGNHMVQRALKDHSELREILHSEELTEQDLLTLVNKLNKHIRFEERELFQEIQKSVPAEDLDALQLPDHKPVAHNYHDPFWL